MPPRDKKEDTDANDVRERFTYDNVIIVPDRGTLTITVDSTRPNEYAFIVHDADGNLLGDGILSSLEFDILSFHINQQPDTPEKPEVEQP